MSRLRRFMGRMRGGEPPEWQSAMEHTADAQLDMGAALIFGLQRKNEKLRFVDHCARVGLLVSAMADLLRLAPAERDDLRAAAQLHEIGMIAVPTRLIEEPSKLDQLSIARIRQQANIGAEIVRITHATRVSLLIESQYSDFASIRARFSDDSRETLLAGLLRAADVMDAMLHPRPYQASLDPSLAETVLRDGTGTKFHPQAVTSLLQLGVGS